MQKRETKLLKLVPLELIILCVTFLLALFTFSFIADEAVFTQENVFDKNVILFFSAHSSPTLIKIMEQITFFGSTTFLFPAYVLLIAWQVFNRRFQYAIDIAVIAISSTLMMAVLKQLFHRHRPALPVIKDIGGYSFPSGHSISSFIFAAILIYLVWKGTLCSVYKYVLMFFLSLYPFAIGLSRIILNVHYATDVIGGFCFAIVWVMLSFLILKKIRKNNLPTEKGTLS